MEQYGPLKLVWAVVFANATVLAGMGFTKFVSCSHQPFPIHADRWSLLGGSLLALGTDILGAEESHVHFLVDFALSMTNAFFHVAMYFESGNRVVLCIPLRGTQYYLWVRLGVQAVTIDLTWVPRNVQ